MTPEQLKVSILQRAMEGKLVPQNPNDEPASELLKRIKTEKEKLISEGKIKRDKKETEIFRGDDGKHYEKFADGSTQEIDVPYDIPENWKWVRIKSIYWNFGQNKPEKFFRYIDTSSIDRKKNIINYKNLQYLSPEQAPSRARKLVSQNSVLFSTVRPYLKNIAVVIELKEYLIASTAFIVLDTLLNETYLKYYLLSDNFINRVNNKSTGTSYPAINDYNFNLLLIAIPPLAEQQRIVEAIESALEKVDEYAESYNRLEQIDKEFPDKLKKSILQYAMQGKIVEQDPNDESVEVLLEKIRAEKQKLFEEGKIKKKDLEISIVSQGDDNSYYDEVPNTWQLLKLKNLLQLDNGTKQQNEHLIYWDAKTLRGIKDAEFKEKGNKVHSKDTVILVDGENSGELFIIPHDGYMGSTFKKIHYLEAGSKKYIDLYIDSKKELLKNSKTGSAIPHLNKTLFKELIVALPPIQEQKRISSKITQIFSQINRLI
ncbi:restriction endonuclease subunit S [Streptococcus taonis]|uniref:Restriction endonuclease subunit S n=1 Tax=Streptococcus taonis TaxID=3041623 RepID=A0ABT6PDE0_9STRE|nr:restriction endonuclease subunit S [Streptococcus sp. ST22-14]MDI1474008.1 restriction endonuclease subunit S [Streptococcus sp. ST22-14]